MNLGLIDYTEAHKKQKQLLKEVISKKSDEKIIFCSHFPVVTCGRRVVDSDLTTWSGPVVHVERGGRATYHGPNQIIVYPILDLSIKRKYIKPCSIRSFLDSLEQVVIYVLKEKYKINALSSKEVSLLPEFEFMEELSNSSLAMDLDNKVSKAEKKMNGVRKKLLLTGVWVGQKKIASIGIALKKWVTYHGISINLDRDDKAFSGLSPCGFRQDIMTSVEECINQEVDRERFCKQLQESCLNMFS